MTLSQKSQDALPGLDLLTPESTGNQPPPTSFYGTNTIEIINDEPEQPYVPESNPQWNTNAWSIPRTSPLMARGTFADTPESPPPAPLPLPLLPNIPNMPPMTGSSVPALPAISPMPMLPVQSNSYSQDCSSGDVDHRGIILPPPPPPIVPLLPRIEDIDHRLLSNLTALPAPVSTPSVRHPTSHQDVDHRNLISLTHQLPAPKSHPGKGDQDYRVPAINVPTDIVESVDMDLSEDEDHQVLYTSQQIADHGRHSFNNNKVLVGGDNGKTNHKEQSNTNLIQINNVSDQVQELSKPLPMTNVYDSMPPNLQTFNAFSFKEREEPNKRRFEEDPRSRSMESNIDTRNPSPPEYEFTNNEWQNQPRPFMNQRFPRNWGPSTNFRSSFVSQQFWPRNGPRPPPRGTGSRPQRFW